MVWDAFSEKWERGFAAAAQYYAEHGNLVMPCVLHQPKTACGLGVRVEIRSKPMQMARFNWKKPRGWNTSESGRNRIIITSSGVKLMRQPSGILRNTGV